MVVKLDKLLVLTTPICCWSCLFDKCNKALFTNYKLLNENNIFNLIFIAIGVFMKSSKTYICGMYYGNRIKMLL